MDLSTLPARSKGGWNVVVETPRGSHVKLAYDPEIGVFTVSRSLILGMSYPYDWGFVPSTKAEDGDPVDAMIFWETETFPGLLVPCRALGVLEVTQRSSRRKGRERNDRILFVAQEDDRTRELTDIRQLGKRRRDELSTFFRQVTTFTNKDVRILGWRSRTAAEKLLRQTMVTI